MFSSIVDGYRTTNHHLGISSWWTRYPLQLTCVWRLLIHCFLIDIVHQWSCRQRLQFWNFETPLAVARICLVFLVVIATLSESIRKKTLFLKFLRIPHTDGVFRHFSTSLRRVPRRWRGPAADRAAPGGRSVSPKVLEPVHFGAKHRRINQYLTLHILVHFLRHSNCQPKHDLV